MASLHGFELLESRPIPELNTQAQLFRHVKTGAELLSLQNEDENKAFSITFRTPPGDSTGVAHILEHSVLCGSRKYPLKEPFIELVKGSLNTFLNAFTGSAETYYPVASQNTQDFYNLIDVYMDAVFYPRLTPQIFQQEGWHYELSDPDAPLTYKGVVFNEMKGAYASPDSILYKEAQRSLFPGNAYGVDSGGDPRVIPDLTYEQLRDFHQTYYHPSNARILFYGDDDSETRLRLMDEYLQDFEPREVDSLVPLQPRFDLPRSLAKSYAVGPDGGGEKAGRFALSWLLTDKIDPETTLALDILEYILIGTPAAPLRKAVIDSGLAEDLGGGVSKNRQRTLVIGAKGLRVDDAPALEALILETLERLATGGVDPATVEAALNTTEFALRENNTGSFPRGLSLMFGAMSAWLYGGNPIDPLAFEAPLAALKKQAQDEPFFENLIRTLLLDNPHRSTLVLQPDPQLDQQNTQREEERLAGVREALSEQEIAEIITQTQELKELQETPDSEEALATLPRLHLLDLPKTNTLIPIATSQLEGVSLVFHDLFTNGIVYFDLGLDLHTLPQDLLPYVPLFGRILLETGTEKEDLVQLIQRIDRKTGGIRKQIFTSTTFNSEEAQAWLFLRGKSTVAQVGDLLSILHDILTGARLDDQARIRQIVLEEKARFEAGVAGAGHSLVAVRLRSRFSESGQVSELTGGIQYLFFLRELAAQIDDDWAGAQSALEQVRRTLVTRGSLICNVTLDAENWERIQPQVSLFLASLPQDGGARQTWSPARPAGPEGLTIPSQVNFVGKAANLFDLGYVPHGSASVISNFLRTTWLWERVRVQGGAYGGFCSYDHLSGVFAYLSYRDPNVLQTLENYDGSSHFLQDLKLSDAELTRSIIGAIGDMDDYQLPDAKGFTSLVRYLVGDTNEKRQRRRDEVLGTRLQDFHAFGEVLSRMQVSDQIAILGSQDAIQAANAERGGDWLHITKVL